MAEIEAVLYKGEMVLTADDVAALVGRMSERGDDDK